MDLFVPLALNLGAYRIKNELEDLSLKYLDPEQYKIISEKREEIEARERPALEQMASIVRNDIVNSGIPIDEKNGIVFRNLSLNTIYKKIEKGYKIENIYDLCYFKILLKRVPDCYQALYIVHNRNKPINGRLRDYICCPRTNYYQSLHTTVSDANGKFRKVKIRTEDMDKIAAFGIPAFWNIKEGGKTIEETQKHIRQKLTARKISEFEEKIKSDREYVDEVRREILSEHIYVHTFSGDSVELPVGATALDFVVQLFPTLIDKITGVIVNDREVGPNTQLNNNDRIQIRTDGKIDPVIWENFENYAASPSSIQKIKEFKKVKQEENK